MTLLDPITQIIGTSDNNIKTIKNFLIDETFNNLYNFCESIKYDLKTTDHHVFQPLPNNIQSILDGIYNDFKSMAKNFYNLDFIDDGNQVCLFAHPIGSSMKPHTDIVSVTSSEKYNSLEYNQLDSIRESHNEVPFHWTGHLAILLYINDEYAGGELYFPERNIKIKPEKNMLICFPGNDYYLHGVKKNQKHARFNLSLFLKFKDFVV